MEVKLKANLQPVPQKWERQEIALLLNLYPRYKAGSSKITAGVMRGHLKSRSMAALSKKYWEIMGSDRKIRVNLNQCKFDFLQEKIGVK